MTIKNLWFVDPELGQKAGSDKRQSSHQGRLPAEGSQRSALSQARWAVRLKDLIPVSKTHGSVFNAHAFYDWKQVTRARAERRKEWRQLFRRKCLASGTFIASCFSIAINRVIQHFPRSNIYFLGTALCLALQSLPAFAGDCHPAAQGWIQPLQQSWQMIRYKTPKTDQAEQYEHLAKEADQIVQAHPDSPEVLTWRGIVLSTYAGARGGLSALGIAKRAKKDFEAAIAMQANCLDGSALASLGVLYAKVPGWPVGFGDTSKARSYLEQALKVSPTSIDNNFFYAEFLLDHGQSQQQEAKTYLERALKASPRPGREIADEGRIAEIKALLRKL